MSSFAKSSELLVVAEVTWGLAQVARERLQTRSMIAKGRDHLIELGANELIAVRVDVGGGAELGVVENVPIEQAEVILTDPLVDETVSPVLADVFYVVPRQEPGDLPRHRPALFAIRSLPVEARRHVRLGAHLELSHADS